MPFPIVQSDPKVKPDNDAHKGETPDTQPDPHYADVPEPEVTGDPEDLDGKEPEDLDNDAEII